jgi:hypothetical protein
MADVLTVNEVWIPCYDVNHLFFGFMTLIPDGGSFSEKTAKDSKQEQFKVQVSGISWMAPHVADRKKLLHLDDICLTASVSALLG